MHIPDHVLDPATCLGTGVASAAAVGYALHRVRTHWDERASMLMGVSAAGIFAAQMLNFPILGGTSGHFMGGALAAILLGPWAGMLVMTAVLVIQCLLFQDGGVTALGANVLNMAVVGVGAGYATYQSMLRNVSGAGGRVVAAAIAAWSSVALAAALCALELSLGAPYRLAPTLAAMLPTHMLIGLGEALMTGIALACVLKARPELLTRPEHFSQIAPSFKPVLAAGLLLAMFMAAVLSPFASSLPDGLEASLQKLAGAPSLEAALVWTPLAGYEISGLQGIAVAGSLAGMIGTSVVFLVAWQMSRRLRSAASCTRTIQFR